MEEKKKIKYSKNTGNFRLDKSNLSIKNFHLDSEEHHNKWAFVTIVNDEVVQLKIEETGTIIKIDTEKKAQLEEEKAQIAEEKKKKEAEETLKQAFIRQEEHQLKSGDSYVLTQAFTPLDTQTQLLDNPENFSLKLNKLSRFDKGADKFKFHQANRGKVDFEIKADFTKINFPTLAENQKTAAEAICQAEAQNFQPDWRLILGLGGASVYETSMILHHIYGFPYIPASSVKGVVRSWIITEVYGQNPESEAKAFHECKILCDIFGCPDSISYEIEENGKKKKKSLDSYYKAHKKEYGFSERQGKAIFFDAFPLSAPKIEVDVMTPHYGDYYGDRDNKKNITPTDTQSPVPIPFLTVAETPFQFLVGSRDEKLLNLEIGGKDEKGNPKNISWWLKDALENHGIGAKTAVGYGYLSQPTNPPSPNGASQDSIG